MKLVDQVRFLHTHKDTHTHTHLHTHTHTHTDESQGIFEYTNGVGVIHRVMNVLSAFINVEPIRAAHSFSHRIHYSSRNAGCLITANVNEIRRHLERESVKSTHGAMR